jgi:DnaJ-related protein SCJ1
LKTLPTVCGARAHTSTLTRSREAPVPDDVIVDPRAWWCAAYEALSDEEKRRIYDQGGEEALKDGGAHGGGGGHDPFDIFSQFFGGGGGKKRGASGKQQLASVHLDLPVTLKDLYNGRTFRMQHKKTVLCSKCRGTGSDNPDDVQTCPKCKGHGAVVEERRLGPGFVQRVQTECPKCGGKGKLITSKCTKCHGHKLEHGAEEELLLVLEEGMPDGHEIVLEQEGDEHPDYTSADLVFHVTTVPDPEMVRDGNDLRIKLHVPLKQALLGVDTVFVHLDGHKVPVQRSGVTPPGYVLKIDNEGMPHHNFPSEHGALYIEFVVDFPATLDELQKALVEQLFP